MKITCYVAMKGDTILDIHGKYINVNALPEARFFQSVKECEPFGVPVPVTC